MDKTPEKSSERGVGMVLTDRECTPGIELPVVAWKYQRSHHNLQETKNHPDTHGAVLLSAVPKLN